jgi:hypothetical protein
MFDSLQVKVPRLPPIRLSIANTESVGISQDLPRELASKRLDYLAVMSIGHCYWELQSVFLLHRLWRDPVLLLLPQCLDGVDAGRPPGRQKSSHGANPKHQSEHNRKGQRIVGLHAV